MGRGRHWGKGVKQIQEIRVLTNDGMLKILGLEAEGFWRSLLALPGDGSNAT